MAEIWFSRPDYKRHYSFSFALSFYLSLGSFILGEIHCYILRTLKQSYGEVHLMGNWDLTPAVPTQMRPLTTVRKPSEGADPSSPCQVFSWCVLAMMSRETLGQKHSSNHSQLPLSQRLHEITKVYHFNLCFEVIHNAKKRINNTSFYFCNGG